MKTSHVETVLNGLNTSFVGLSLFLLTDLQKQSSQLFRVSISDAVVGALKEVVMSYLTKTKSSFNGSSEIECLNFDSEQDVCFIEKDKCYGSDRYDVNRAGDYVKATKINHNRVRAWMVKLELKDSEVYFFQRFFPSKMLRKGFTLFEKEDRFDLFTGRQISIQDSFDCYIHDGFCVITNIGNFESIFKYDVAYEEKSREFVKLASDASLSEKLVIIGIEKISSKLIANKRFMKKIFAIMQSKRYEQIDFESLSEFIDAHDGKFKLAVDAQGKSIEVGDDTSCEELLCILNDDYTKSQFTTYEYVSQKKTDF